MSDTSSVIDESGAGASVTGAGSNTGSTSTSSAADAVGDVGQGEAFLAANLSGVRLWNANEKMVFEQALLELMEGHRQARQRYDDAWQDARAHANDVRQLSLVALKDSVGESNRSNNNANDHLAYAFDKLVNINETDQLAAKTPVEQDIAIVQALKDLINSSKSA